MSPMRKIIISLVFTSLLAGTLTLAQESFTIQQNGRTYTCHEDGSDPYYSSCDSAVESLRQQISSCHESHNYSNKAVVCAEQFWPSFKSLKPECAFEGSTACYQLCLSEHNYSNKAQKCSEVCSN